MKYQKANNIDGIIGRISWNNDLCLFSLAFLIRALPYIVFLRNDPGIFARYGDSLNYVNAVNNMLDYGVFCEQNVYPPYPGIFRTPGYPVFLAAIYYFSGRSNAIVVFIQLIISALNCVIFFRIASRYSSRKAAIFPAVLLALDLASIKSANEIMTETLFTFFLLFMVWLILRFFEQGRVWYIIAAGAVYALAVLTRPILLYFFLLMPFIFWTHFRRNIRKLGYYSLLFISIFALLTVPWIFRNYKLGYKGFAAVQEVNVYIFKAGWIEERLKGSRDYSDIDFAERFKKVDRVLESRGIENTPYTRVRIYKELGTETVLSNPLLALEYQVTYMFRALNSLGLEPFLPGLFSFLPDRLQFVKEVSGNMSIFVLYLSYFLFIIGVASKNTLMEFKVRFFVILLLGYLAVLSGEWGAESRFRVPVMPLFLIFSSVGTDKIINIFKNTISIWK